MLVRSVQLALHWSWRWMPDGIYSRRQLLLRSMEILYVCLWNQWNPWKHQPAQIRDRNIRALFFFRIWLTCQMWTELGQRAALATLWLALCPAALHSSISSPLDVIITQSNPLPPQWGPLCLLSFLFTYFKSAFTRSISVWIALTLSLYLPPPLYH